MNFALEREQFNEQIVLCWSLKDKKKEGGRQVMSAG